MIWQAAAVLGVEPWRYTLRELLDQSERRARYEWGHTATICWVLAETQRNPQANRRPWTVADFVPRALQTAEQLAERPGWRRQSRDSFRAEARRYFEARRRPVPERLRTDDP